MSVEPKQLVPQSLLDTIPCGAYVVDDEGTVQQFNHRATELWGRTPTAGDGSSKFCGSVALYLEDGTLLPHEKTPVAAVLADGRPRVGKMRVIVEQPSGERVTVSPNIGPITDDSGKVIGAINCFDLVA